MIPKIIHYCWFGGKPLNEKAQMCVESWKKILPDYEIRRWDESNFDFNCCEYVKQAYEAGKWAFVADYFRFWALYNYGGIYFDSDVEVVKSFDEFLSLDFFTGYETQETLEAAVIGAAKGNSICKKMLDHFHRNTFLVDGKPNLEPLPALFTKVVVEEFDFKKNYKKTIQLKNNSTIYPVDYFSPMDCLTFKVKATKNTHCIHRFTNSWRSPEGLEMIRIQGKYCKIFGTKLGLSLYYHGFWGTVKKAFKKIFGRR